MNDVDDNQTTNTHVTDVNATIITINGRLALSGRRKGRCASIKLNKEENNAISD
jgi:hypothetical protein